MPRKPAISTSEIADLLSAEPDSGFRRAKTLLRFCAQLRYPVSPQAVKLAYEVMCAKYVSEKVPTELEAGSMHLGDAVQLLLRDANASRMIDVTTSEAFFEVDFSGRDEASTDFRHAANVVRFLISYSSDSDDRRKGPSIKKAYFVVAKNTYYDKNAFESWAWFSELWSTFKPVSFFHYVNEYDFKRKLLLNPRDQDFTAQVDALIKDRVGLEAFFRKSLFVLNKVRKVLYRSAFQGVVLPRFPPELTPLPMVTTEVDDRLRKLMDEYSTTVW
jgi:hypothetical protein